MYLIFFISATGILLILPFYFWSLEHKKFFKHFGQRKGKILTATFGLISGWGFFLFLFGLWISPQPRFNIPILTSSLNFISFFSFSISVLHFIISLPIILIGAWFGIVGVRETSLKVAETHRPEKIINTGVYSRIRHPQYFGAILSHIGISILLSSLYSTLSIPIIVFIIFLLSWKEEKELYKEFGQEYEDYKKNVPMLLPRLRKKF
jgi:protein-S-isoprenylcysteine O-methyltransferase Ste14